MQLNLHVLSVHISVDYISPPTYTRPWRARNPYVTVVWPSRSVRVAALGTFEKSKSMKTSRVVRLSASKNSYSMPIHNAQMTMTLAFHFETLKLA